MHTILNPYDKSTDLACTTTVAKRPLDAQAFDKNVREPGHSLDVGLRSHLPTDYFNSENTEPRALNFPYKTVSKTPSRGIAALCSEEMEP